MLSTIIAERKCPIRIVGWKILDSPETSEWVKAENRITSAYLEKLADRRLSESG